jgi:hypothetical protein
LLKVTLVGRWVASAPQMVGLNGPLPVPVTLSYVMSWMLPIPGLLPHRRRVPIFCVRGEGGDQDRLLVVDEQTQPDGALGGGDGTGELGVPEVQPPVDRPYRAGGAQRKVPDRQPAQPEQRPERRAVVLHLVVPDEHLDRPGTVGLVHQCTEESVAEERAVVPVRGKRFPDQVLAREEGAPRRAGGHPVIEQRRGRGARTGDRAEITGGGPDADRSHQRPPGQPTHRVPPRYPMFRSA